MWLLAKKDVVNIPKTLYSEVASSNASSQFKESSSHNISVSTRVLYQLYSTGDLMQNKVGRL